MGAPSPEQIDEAIAWGLANRWSEERIVRHLATLERMSDEELAAVGVFPPRPNESAPLPSRPAWPSPSIPRPRSPSTAPSPRAGAARKETKWRKWKDPRIDGGQGDV